MGRGPGSVLGNPPGWSLARAPASRSLRTVIPRTLDPCSGVPAPGAHSPDPEPVPAPCSPVPQTPRRRLPDPSLQLGVLRFSLFCSRRDAQKGPGVGYPRLKVGHPWFSPHANFGIFCFSSGKASCRCFCLDGSECADSLRKNLCLYGEEVALQDQGKPLLWFKSFLISFREDLCFCFCFSSLSLFFSPWHRKFPG